MVVKTKKIKIMSSMDVATAVKHPEIFPWDFKDKSISEITCANVFEFVKSDNRGKFMDEIWRIMADDGKCTLTVPYYTSWIAVHDYRLQWPPFNEQSFLMFNKEWREVNQKNIQLKCNFDFTYGYALEPEVEARNDETRSFQIKYYNNSIKFLTLVLTKRRK